MFKLLAFGIFVLCSPLIATSAHECYATDRDALESGNNYVSIENCEDYMTETYRRMNLGNLNLPTNCFTVQVYGHAPLNNFKVKGCVPKGMCGAARKQVIEGIEKKGLKGSIKRITCRECPGDNCNEYH